MLYINIFIIYEKNYSQSSLRLELQMKVFDHDRNEFQSAIV